ncbi:PREDICTED: coiled-coil domain-containing protein lobo homolog [Vollenhovia emeryi]|uniref:coiled-coil domain-containing protein lobo homolog n=1 Tax=Vollenhovia emeryi TaxID=411798 RepID=UPI0005F450DD|nr:PREDICTED: coiled-coil domain-containing protein lobo homolog [Vollenhovia emeryi]
MNDIVTIQEATDATAKQFKCDNSRLASPDGYPEDKWRRIEKSDRTPEEILRQVQRELCLIKLCLPTVSIITEDLYVQSLPDSYRCVNDKERLLLWYAENFRRQFHAKYTNRRPLLLACENECRVQKYISSSINESTLPFRELDSWRGCVRFISDCIAYQPLDNAFIPVSQQTF